MWTTPGLTSRTVDGVFPRAWTSPRCVNSSDSRGRGAGSIVQAHRLDEVGQPGPRWRGAEPATLERVLFHLVQEYARHLGQLDVVVELATGTTGE